MRYPILPALILFVGVTLQPALARDPDIDRLLKKLPPPEKLVKTEVAPGIHRNDPILQDPLGLEMNKAFAKGDAARALGFARRLSARHPTSPLGHFLRGTLAFEVRRFSEAASAFREAVSLEPRFAQAHLGLGAAEMAQSRLGAALPHLERATQLEPRSLTGWIVQSACCLQLGRKQESVAAARRATALAPRSAIAWRQLAAAAKAAGHGAEAALATDKANGISPYLDPRVPHPVDALPAVRRAAQLQPKDPGAQFHLGYTLLHAGRTEEALVVLRKTVTLNPKHAGAWRELGVACRKLKRHREADAAFAQADRLLAEIASPFRAAKRGARRPLTKSAR
jgi:tetratricopeptide (TPR) repeat protein